MLSSPYHTTLKLSVFQITYTSEVEIASTAGKLNADQRAKGKKNGGRAKKFESDLLTVGVQFWKTQGV